MNGIFRYDVIHSLTPYAYEFPRLNVMKYVNNLRLQSTSLLLILFAPVSPSSLRHRICRCVCVRVSISLYPIDMFDCAHR